MPAMPLAFEPEDLTGTRIGDYTVVRLLGRGGMGDVYLARQQSLNRPVALKVLQRRFAQQAECVRRFRVEAEACGRFNHPNIVQVYAVGEVYGRPFLALEYVDGLTLAECVQKTGPLPVRAALRVLRGVAAALHEAGEHDVIHRDIKPENILLTRRGEVKVADFGLARCRLGAEDARLTESGLVLGTPLYMNPEQVQGNRLTRRSDIYSLGVTAFCMLAGRPPYTGDTAFDVALQHVQGRPASLSGVRPELPSELCAIIARMMARDPAQRYACGRDILHELSARFGPDVSGDMAMPMAPRMGRPVRATRMKRRKTTLMLPDEAPPRPLRWPAWLAAAAVFLIAIPLSLPLLTRKLPAAPVATSESSKSAPVTKTPTEASPK